MKRIIEHLNDMICGAFCFLYIFDYVIEETDGLRDNWYVWLFNILFMAMSIGCVRRHIKGLWLTVKYGTIRIFRKIFKK